MLHYDQDAIIDGIFGNVQITFHKDLTDIVSAYIKAGWKKPDTESEPDESKIIPLEDDGNELDDYIAICKKANGVGEGYFALMLDGDCNGWHASGKSRNDALKNLYKIVSERKAYWELQEANKK